MFGKGKTYHIIGGGLAGLAAAKHLKEKNKNNRVIVYEAAAHLGGRCYSFYDSALDRNLDNATHVILGANRHADKIIKNPAFHKKPYFFADGKINSSLWNNQDLILRSVFNTQSQEVAKKSLFNLGLKLFPFTQNQTKIYFSNGNLSQELIAPLSAFADEIHLGWKLVGFSTQERKINKLKFNKEEVIISPQESIICALDASQYHKIFNGPAFEFNPIIDIYYRTSIPLTLPQNIPFVGTPQLSADWVFIKEDIVGVTISDAKQLMDTKADDLARKIWQEVRSINNINAAFLPAYKVIKHKRATIKQDQRNNDLRPQNCFSAYQNMTIAGDWTMKNWPCCIEAAICSGIRAANAS